MLRAGCAVRRFTSRCSGSGPLILDIVSVTAAAAYSLRLLRVAYTGAAVNIRRSSDNATQDIGFVNGSLDTSSLAAFIGGGNGFVAKWYDQSGSGNDALQTTTGNQPTFVSTVAALNGRSALLFVNAGAINLTAPAASSINNMFANGGYNTNVLNYTGGATQTDRVWDKTAISFLIGTAGQTNLDLIQQAGTQGSWQAPNLSAGAHIVDVDYSSAALANVATITYDGTDQTTSKTQPTGTITSDAATALTIGSNANTGGVRGWPGHIVEVVFWKTTVPTAAQKTAIRANQKAYWGTP